MKTSLVLCLALLFCVAYGQVITPLASGTCSVFNIRYGIPKNNTQYCVYVPILYGLMDTVEASTTFFDCTFDGRTSVKIVSLGVDVAFPPEDTVAYGSYDLGFYTSDPQFFSNVAQKGFTMRLADSITAIPRNNNFSADLTLKEYASPVQIRSTSAFRGVSRLEPLQEFVLQHDFTSDYELRYQVDSNNWFVGEGSVTWPQESIWAFFSGSSAITNATFEYTPEATVSFNLWNWGAFAPPEYIAKTCTVQIIDFAGPIRKQPSQP